MSDTGKLKPSVSVKGLFLPWPLVFTLLVGVAVSIGVPVLGWWYETRRAVDLLEHVQAEQREQRTTITNHGERIATLEARKP